MFHTVKGDVFKSKCDIIAHGCNCKGAFGSGVAGQMARIHPLAQRAYFEKHKTEGWRLGDAQFVESKGQIIANLGTQKNYGNAAKTGQVYCDYEGIREAMTKVYEYAKANNKTVAIPKIGAGLAGGDWSTIKKIIKAIFHDYDIYYFEYDP